MATWYERFGVLGLNKPSVEGRFIFTLKSHYLSISHLFPLINVLSAALKILGAFSAKNFELLT